jgi:DNA-binding HxlR family transcriptional regulator
LDPTVTPAAWEDSVMAAREESHGRSHGQYCPVAYAADALGDRWSLLILREIVGGGASRFNEIERGLPKVSRSLLSQRLRHLERLGLIDAVPLSSGRGKEYRPTPAGKDLEPVLTAMGEWAIRWIIGEPRPEELDPMFVLWWLHRRVNFDELPSGRTVVRFDVVDAGRVVCWLVLERGTASVCPTDPGFPATVQVTADSLQLHRVFAGRITLADALRDGSITIDGPGPLVRQFPRWFAWSPFYDSMRRHLADQRA